MGTRGDHADACPVFGVESGGPVIGLGVLVILFGLVPLLISPRSFPFFMSIVFLAFGLFLIWIGFRR